MRIAICDDEEAQRLLLEKYLMEWGEQHQTIVCTELFPSAESFLFSWEEDRQYDLLVLDIELGKMNGVELARTLRGREEELPILFITGYDSYMAQGYEVAALHYLLKPVNREKLFSALDRLQRQRERGVSEEKILFQAKEGVLSLPLSGIWYIEACGHQCVLCTKEQEYMLKQSISAAEKALAGRREIVRCHRSYLVNLQHISAITGSELVLDNKKRLPVSRSLCREVNEAFIAYYSAR